MRWNIVDKPWDFYSIQYILEDYVEHIVYIPAAVIAEELKTMSIVDIIVNKLRAELACEPKHVDRVTEEMKNATKRSAIQATKRSKKYQLD